MAWMVNKVLGLVLKLALLIRPTMTRYSLFDISFICFLDKRSSLHDNPMSKWVYSVPSKCGFYPLSAGRFVFSVSIIYFRKHERKVNYNPSNIYHVSQNNAENYSRKRGTCKWRSTFMNSMINTISYITLCLVIENVSKY